MTQPQLQAPIGPARIDGVALLGSWILLVLVIPYAVFSYFDEIEFSTEVIVSLSILFYCALRLTWLAGLGKPKLLSITFFVFIYVWVGLAASAQLIAGQFPWEAMHKDEDVLPALFEIVLAIVAWEAGHLWFRLRPPAASTGRAFEGLSLVIPDRAVVWLSVVALGLTLIGMKTFGFNHLFLTHAAMASVWASAGTKAESLVGSILLRAPSLIAFNVIAYNGLRRWRSLNKERKRFYFVMGIFMGALYFVANYPPAQSRFWLGAVVLTPAFALPRWRRWFAPMWVLGFAAGLTVVFPYMDMFRRATTLEQGFQQFNVNEAVTKKLIQKADYDAFQQTIDGYRFGERIEGSTMGRNFIGAALFWVPRALWSGKPNGTGLEVAESNDRFFTNLSAPMWMEFYYGFGWMGIAGLMLVYARFCAWGESLYERTLLPGAPDSLARLMVPYWAAFHIFMLRGDLMNATAYSSFGYVMLLATAILPRVWGRNPPAGAPFPLGRR